MNLFIIIKSFVIKIFLMYLAKTGHHAALQRHSMHGEEKEHVLYKWNGELNEIKLSVNRIYWKIRGNKQIY